MTLRAFQGRAAAEFQAAIEDLFEQSSLLLSRKDFAIAIRRGDQFNMNDAPAADASDIVDATVVASIEGVRDSQNR